MRLIAAAILVAGGAVALAMAEGGDGRDAAWCVLVGGAVVFAIECPAGIRRRRIRRRVGRAEASEAHLGAPALRFLLLGGTGYRLRRRNGAPRWHARR
jgi:hypothetical protein